MRLASTPAACWPLRAIGRPRAVEFCVRMLIMRYADAAVLCRSVARRSCGCSPATRAGVAWKFFARHPGDGVRAVRLFAIERRLAPVAFRPTVPDGGRRRSQAARVRDSRRSWGGADRNAGISDAARRGSAHRVAAVPDRPRSAIRSATTASLLAHQAFACSTAGRAAESARRSRTA